MKTSKDKTRLRSTSKNDSIKSRCFVFFFSLVPVSQWGTRSARKWEAIAKGIAINGFGTAAAIAVPIKAWLVAVIHIL